MNDYLKTHLCDIGVTTIRDAFRIQDGLEHRIIFLTNGGRLAASLSDGDIRRFILKGGNIDGLASQAANMDPVVCRDRNEGLAILKERPNLKIIPVVSDGVIVDLVYEFGSAATDLNLPVVINAGGKGARLDPYTRILPKPLIPVGDRPIIELIMDKFRKYSCDDFSVIVNYKKELIKAYFKDINKDYRISWFDEERFLGTGGGLRMLKDRISQTFIFTNCDVLIDTDYGCLLDHHRNNKNLVTMVCAYMSIKVPYGTVKTDSDGLISEFKEKPEFSFLTNTGLYIVEPETIGYINENEEIDFPDVIERLRKKGLRVGIYPVSEREWLDMGQPEELERMRDILSENRGHMYYGQ
ncbi:MAG: nucleotidyltransferase family protein [Lachnospiraceae bacterium]|nr:nucleotidyltransferase family protein [Lachnospiraceae bacterium]